MEDRLKNLRKTMEKTVFKELDFTEDLQKKARKKINKLEVREEDILLSVLQLLTQEKTGFELAKYIRRRGIQTFEDQEGFLYTVLHRLERNGFLHSRWGDQDAKYYQLTHKGKKLLTNVEEGSRRKKLILKEILVR